MLSFNRSRDHAPATSEPIITELLTDTLNADEVINTLISIPILCHSTNTNVFTVHHNCNYIYFSLEF